MVISVSSALTDSTISMCTVYERNTVQSDHTGNYRLINRMIVCVCACECLRGLMCFGEIPISISRLNLPHTHYECMNRTYSDYLLWFIALSWVFEVHYLIVMAFSHLWHESRSSFMRVNLTKMPH